MRIILNGAEKELAQEINLKNLIGQFCRDPQRVIAELNGTVVKSREWEQQALKDGDTLELVNFVGGG